MKLRTKWIWIAVVVALVGVGVLRALSKRNAQQEAVASVSNTKAEAVVELAASDMVRAQVRELTQGLAISGALKAADSAVVKARVAGELRAMTVREGDAVKVGQVLARIDPTEYQARFKQAQEQGLAAKSQIDIAQRQYDNNKALVDQGFISPTALDASKASLQGAQASYQAAQAAADVARKAVADTVLRSPIDGQVAQRLAQNGERVAVEARILEVVDLSRLELEALMGPADSVAVRLGQKATLRVEGRSDPLEATVVRINPSAQAGSRSVPVYLAIDNRQPMAALRQGLFVQGTLAVGRAERLTVPLDAVRTDKPLPYVQVVDNGRVAHRNVQTGQRMQVDNQTVVAIEGVPEGTLVLAGRVGTLPEGTVLRLPGSQAAPAAAASTPAAAKP